MWIWIIGGHWDLLRKEPIAAWKERELDLGLFTEKVIMKKMNYYAEGIQKFERHLALELSSLVDILKAVQEEPHKDREPTN